MRRASRTDDNQAEIVAALRAVGAVVQDLSRVGQGCPDLLVSHGGRMALLEVKDGRKPPSARQLTPAQVAWHRAWRALNGRIDADLHARFDGWYGARLLQDLTGQSCADRKARKLRALGFLDWRRVVDHTTGGHFVEFRVAMVPGEGREIKPDAALDRRGAAAAPSPAPAGVAQQRSLFDVPQDRTVNGRAR